MSSMIDDVSVTTLARSVREVLSQEGMGVLRNSRRFYSFLSDKYGGMISPEMAVLSRTLTRDDGMGLFSEFAQLDCGSSKDDVLQAVERAAQRMVRDDGVTEEDAYACATALGLGIAHSLGVNMPDAKTLLAKGENESGKEPDVAQQPEKKTGKKKSTSAGQSGTKTTKSGKKTTGTQQSVASTAQGGITTSASTGTPVDNNYPAIDDWDPYIVKWLADQFQTDYGIDLRTNERAMARLKAASAKAVNELSSDEQTNICLLFITDDVYGPKHLDYTLTRNEYERISGRSVKSKPSTAKAATKKASSQASTSKPAAQQASSQASTSKPATQQASSQPSTSKPAAQQALSQINAGKAATNKPAANTNAGKAAKNKTSSATSTVKTAKNKIPAQTAGKSVQKNDSPKSTPEINGGCLEDLKLLLGVIVGVPILLYVGIGVLYFILDVLGIGREGALVEWIEYGRSVIESIISFITGLFS